ncbi:MAG: DUF5060 domain-containing protein [Bacteroidales bacterium]|nr:DUF5060 domain-containing protein [Bacteroidales bacterium]
MLAVLLSVVLGLNGPAKVSAYDKAEFSITVSGGSWDNPYRSEEAAVDMEFYAPDGRHGVLPCFFSGSDSTWIARFTPTQSGRYSLRFIYTEDEEFAADFDDQTLIVYPSESKGFLHPRDNWTFAFDDGTPFRGIGENLCWESRIEDDNPHLSELHEQADVYNYDVMLPKLKNNGGNFTRMWMCSWNFPIDRQKDINNPRYEETDEPVNASAVERLDHVLDLADSLDIKIMLCMGQGNVVADKDFFTTEDAKARYRNYLRYIVARWSYSPAIAAWEFFNEVDNIQFADSDNPIPAAAISNWHAEMAKYLRDLDPHCHMITTSISHRDIEGLNSIPEIDFNQKHIYKGTAGIPNTISKYEEEFGKPYVIGEAGYEWDWFKNFEEIADGLDMDFTRAMYYGLFNPTPIAPMSWWWEWFDSRGTDRKIEEVRALSDQMLEAGGGCFEPLEVRVAGNDGYAVRCGKKVFVYIFNPTTKPITTFSVVIGDHKTYRITKLNILPNKEQTFIL